MIKLNYILPKLVLSISLNCLGADTRSIESKTLEEEPIELCSYDTIVKLFDNNCFIIDFSEQGSEQQKNNCLTAVQEIALYLKKCHAKN